MKKTEEVKRKRGRPAKEGALTATERVAQMEAELVKAGGRTLNRLRLEPEANAALKELREGDGDFDSDRKVINIAIIELNKRRRKK